MTRKGFNDALERILGEPIPRVWIRSADGTEHEADADKLIILTPEQAERLQAQGLTEHIVTIL